MGVEAGLRDWKLQRVSAYIMLLYFGYLFAFFIGHPHLSFERWTALFSSVWMQVSTLTVFVLLAIHAWIGMWTIGTDYVDNFFMRKIYEIVIFVALIAYFFWVVQILWSF